MSDAPLAPGSTIGILGGGQLGRMLALAAARLGLKCHIYEPAADCPAAQVADRHTAASYDDAAALEAFGKSVDVITYEFENIPTAALDLLGGLAPIRPGRRALEVSQDRLTEKSFLEGLGLATAPFADIPDLAALEAALAEIGTPAILKTRRFGYDGKGQVRIKDPSEAAEAFAALKGAPAILEGFVKFSCEISVIGARGTDGAVACYDPGENVHLDGILHTTTVPAKIPARLRTDAVLLAGRILSALDYVGVMGVELFATPSGLVVNEIAPRVHNSGHWTQTGCSICQFEQHVRAVAGWPLGRAERHSDVEMLNLIGDDVLKVQEFAADGATAIHLYGKAEARPGRKMGHVNRILPAQG
ncbi:5-(carboxyamino)imidazole ribonucleotide synthase [Mangrovicoccus sp. HB161399]|uniref:5-(carboxyamino)imidazole ribonucleotide synthase n=1 Tax=Mangrovicoccus sp. HB161399 TaxID=2720392 RepID=UPI001551D87F|nr:5-(carboxyamino)imidazole ribonucleotide synthase [Mangrovicoccus sp. HB161399]